MDGYNATLNLSCSGGNVYVSFHADLGSSRHSPPFCSFDNERNFAHVKPCLYREEKEERNVAMLSNTAASLDNDMERADPIKVIEDAIPNVQSYNLQTVNVRRMRKLHQFRRRLIHIGHGHHLAKNI